MNRKPNRQGIPRHLLPALPGWTLTVWTLPAWVLTAWVLLSVCHHTAAAVPSRVVASTTWAGAVATAAGAAEVRVLAPPTLQHPPEYEPRPSDLLAVSQANVLVLGGFERAAQRLREALGAAGEVIQVRLDYTPGVTEAEVRRLAACCGDPAAAEVWIAALESDRRQLKTTLDAVRGPHRPRAMVQRFMVPWANLAGLEVVGTFGMDADRPSELARLLALKPEIIIDNTHAPGGLALAATGVPRVVLRNFPGADLDLIAVYRDNAEQLAMGLRALGSSPPTPAP